MLLRLCIYFLPFPPLCTEDAPKDKSFSLEFLVFTKSRLSLQVPIFALGFKQVLEIHGLSTPCREHSRGQRWHSLGIRALFLTSAPFSQMLDMVSPVLHHWFEPACPS